MNDPMTNIERGIEHTGVSAVFIHTTAHILFTPDNR